METKKLTPAQKAIIELRMKALEKDFGLQAYRLVFNETDYAEKGNWAPSVSKKKKFVRGPIRGKLGALAESLRPWIKLALENPGQPIKIRPSDADNQPIDRMQSGATALANQLVGAGMLKTTKVKDDVEGYAIILTAKERPRQSTTATVVVRGGNVSTMGNGQAAPGIAA